MARGAAAAPGSHPSLVPYQDFPTADGAMLLAIGNDGQFQRFCAVAGRPQWASDERYASNTLRVRHRGTLVPMIGALTRTRNTADWVALLSDKAVPCGPINDIGTAFADPQVRARGLVVQQQRTGDDGVAESLATVASPLRLQATPPVLRRAPPRLGEHTDEVLVALGLDAPRIASLRAQGVV
ncbi:CoA transferase [Leptospira sp. 96542]|nr:CoA transferase [Leptospira sp. 96542]